MQEVSDTGVFVFDDFPDPDNHPGGWMLHNNWLLFASHIPVLNAMTGFSGVTAGEFSSFNFPNCDAYLSSTVTYSITTSTIKANTGSLHVYPNLSGTDGSGTLYFHGAAHVFSTGLTVNGPIGGSGVANVILGSDFTTTSATATNVTGMSFSVGASQQWTAEIHIHSGCSTANGIKWAISVPAGATLHAVVFGSGGNTAVPNSSILTSSGTLTTQTYNQFAASTGQLTIRVTVTTSVTAGSVQLQVAAQTGGDTATVYAGSYLTGRRVS